MHYRAFRIDGTLDPEVIRIMSRILCTGIACTAYATLASAQSRSKPFVIEHVRVFDGTRVIENTSVLVEGAIIRSVAASVPRPPDATVIDGTGKMLLPGLIDAHTRTIR